MRLLVKICLAFALLLTVVPRLVVADQLLSRQFTNDTLVTRQPVFRLGGADLRIPLRNPSIHLPGCLIGVEGEIPAGASAWIFPDGAVSSPSPLKISISGKVPMVSPGGIMTVSLAVDKAMSMPPEILQIRYERIRPLSTSAYIINPSGAEIDRQAVITVPLGLRRAWVSHLGDGRRVELGPEYFTDGELRWPGVGERPEPGFYEIEIPGVHDNPRGVASLCLVRRAAIAYAIPAIFSPNGDGVFDTTNFFFNLVDGTFKSVVVRDGDGRDVRQLSEKRFVDGQQIYSWDGRDSGGNFVGDGLYNCVVLDVTGEEKLGATVTVNTSRRWDAEFDDGALAGIFPLGLHFAGGQVGNSTEKPDTAAFTPLGWDYWIIPARQLFSGEDGNASLYTDKSLRFIVSMDDLVSRPLPDNEEMLAERVRAAAAPAAETADTLALLLDYTGRFADKKVSGAGLKGELPILAALGGGRPPVVGMDVNDTAMADITTLTRLAGAVLLIVPTSYSGDFPSSLAVFRAVKRLGGARPVWVSLAAGNMGASTSMGGAAILAGARGFFLRLDTAAAQSGGLDGVKPQILELGKRLRLLRGGLAGLEGIGCFIRHPGLEVGAEQTLLTACFVDVSKVPHLMAYNGGQTLSVDLAVDLDNYSPAPVSAGRRFLGWTGLGNRGTPFLVNFETGDRTEMEICEESNSLRTMLRLLPGEFALFRLDGVIPAVPE